MMSVVGVLLFCLYVRGERFGGVSAGAPAARSFLALFFLLFLISLLSRVQWYLCTPRYLRQKLTTSSWRMTAKMIESNPAPTPPITINHNTRQHWTGTVVTSDGNLGGWPVLYQHAAAVRIAAQQLQALPFWVEYLN
jgi:hypothetical protein